MENNIYNDDLENFLKDTADNFRMYPSKRVWHSLYNNLHPGRRWPSLAVCMLLISGILFISISNNNSVNNINRHKASENILANSKKYSSDDNADIINAFKNNSSFVIDNIFNTTAKKTSFRYTNTISNNISKTNLINSTAFNHLSNHKEPTLKNTSTTFKAHGISNDTELAVKIYILSPIDIIKANPNTEADREYADVIKKIKAADYLINKLTSADTKDIAKINIADKSWIEDYAFHNKASLSKWKRNVAFQYYLTPSIGFRQLYKNYELPSTASLANNNPLLVNNSTNNLSLKDKITQSSAINIEAGGTVLYSLSRRFRFKSGLQFNYTSYNVDANELQHPNQTNLLLNDLNTGYAILSPRISFYANSTSDENKKKLKNSTFQFSIPIGTDYKLAGKNNLKWYAGASVQPTFITGGHLYALSADEKNYIEDPSLLRQWNLNASVETFLSYKTINGVIISAGPQLRYQFFSTYDKRYTYTEKLYNFGVKLGIATHF